VTWKLFIVLSHWRGVGEEMRADHWPTAFLLSENAVAAFALGPTLPRISLRRRDRAGLESPTG
jgi:hypothetical protein